MEEEVVVTRPNPHFEVGDVVFIKEHKRGVVKQVDPKNVAFHFYVEYADGTKKWEPSFADLQPYREPAQTKS